jgi:indole-3-glycerol phosphate synthase
MDVNANSERGENDLAPAVRSILAAARERSVETDERKHGQEQISITPRDLSDALAAADADKRVPVIAEIKPTSPTTDNTRTEDPVMLAQEMVDGGAAALSVLTEPEHFGGSTETLERVREAVDVPVLRKDFILREEQLDAVKSDAVLLIARFINNLSQLLVAARDRGFQVLVEVHTGTEMTRAVKAGADIIGINNRDLAQLDVDLGTFERVGPAPDDVTLIAESGITTPKEAARMRRAGADGLLIGSALMDGDVETNTERLTTPIELR